jgi:hypothetical protein
VNAPMGRVNVAPTRTGAGRAAAAPPARSGMRPTVSRASASGFGRGNQAGGFNNQKPFAGRTATAAPGRAIPNAPGPGSNPGMVSNNTRNVPSPMARNLPRPTVGDVGTARNGTSPAVRNVPRPPASGMTGRPPESHVGGRQQIGANTQARGTFSPAPAQRSVPRPPTSFGSRESQPMTQRSVSSPMQSPSAMQGARNRPTTAVPRPTGPIRPASDYNRMSNNSYGGSRPNYSASSGGYSSPSRQPSYSPSNRGGYGSVSRQPSYSPDRGGYSTSPRYSAPQYSVPRSGGSPSYGSSPSYRSSGPSYSAPSYGGGRASMGGGSPSYRSAPSYGGGGGSRSGGGGGGSYHGGGGGGGGRASSGGGHGGGRR